MKSLFVIIAILGTAAHHLHAEPRVWTRTDGKTVIADLIAATATHATLKLASESNYEIRLSELSLNDQKFVAQWQTKRSEAKSEGHFMTMWTLTDDKRHSGSKSLKLAIELNGEEEMRIPLPIRNYVLAGEHTFKDLNLPISPLEIKKVRIVVERGSDAWRPASFIFQFRTGDHLSSKLEFRVERWLSMDKSEGDQHKTFITEDKIHLTAP